MSRGPEQLRLTPDERADLVAYIDGELPEGVSRSLATKLTNSATGRREVEMLRKTWELLGHLPVPASRSRVLRADAHRDPSTRGEIPIVGSSSQDMDGEDGPCRRLPDAGGREPGTGLCGDPMGLARSWARLATRSLPDSSTWTNTWRSVRSTSLTNWPILPNSVPIRIDYPSRIRPRTHSPCAVIRHKLTSP